MLYMMIVRQTGFSNVRALFDTWSITVMLKIMCQNTKNIILLGYFTMGYGCCEDIKVFSGSWVGPEVD